MLEQCSIVVEQCSIILGQCSIMLEQCSIMLGQCSIMLKQCSIMLGQCSIMLEQCSVMGAQYLTLRFAQAGEINTFSSDLRIFGRLCDSSLISVTDCLFPLPMLPHVAYSSTLCRHHGSNVCDHIFTHIEHPMSSSALSKSRPAFVVAGL